VEAVWEQQQRSQQQRVHGVVEWEQKQHRGHRRLQGEVVCWCVATNAQ
jgi:hypothetical protein